MKPQEFWLFHSLVCIVSLSAFSDPWALAIEIQGIYHDFEHIFAPLW